jgi:hypothetical protein
MPQPVSSSVLVARFFAAFSNGLYILGELAQKLKLFGFLKELDMMLLVC